MKKRLGEVHALLPVSADFIEPDYCYDIEMRRDLKQIVRAFGGTANT